MNIPNKAGFLGLPAKALKLTCASVCVCASRSGHLGSSHSLHPVRIHPPARNTGITQNRRLRSTNSSVVHSMNVHGHILLHSNLFTFRFVQLASPFIKLNESPWLPYFKLTFVIKHMADSLRPQNVPAPSTPFFSPHESRGSWKITKPAPVQKKAIRFYQPWPSTRSRYRENAKRG